MEMIAFGVLGLALVWVTYAANDFIKTFIAYLDLLHKHEKERGDHND